MLVNLVILFISAAAVWLLVHVLVKRRFARLEANLADMYHYALAVLPEAGETPQLMALCVDLMRKDHCAVPFDDLSENEQKMVLHAYAIEAVPFWMSRYAALRLSPANKLVASQLRQVKSSRPQKPKQHFGAVKRQQQLRSASES